MRGIGAALGGLLTACGVLCLSGCGGSDEATKPGVFVGYDDAGLAELETSQIGKYLGQFQPAKSDVRDNVTTYTFDRDPAGPICLWGDAFAASTRKTGSNKLLIYLQGGGACWSALCAANETANAGILPLGWTDGDTTQNPLGDFDVAYLAYCDGSVFSGDNQLQVDYKGSPKTRYHHGVMNLSAGIDLALKDFPHPKQIVLAGSSAGGYGTLVGTALTRLAYPHVPLTVINDAGLGLSNPDDPSILQAATDEWQALKFMPATCDGCSEGQLTAMIGWHLEHDLSLREGGFSSFEDGTIGGVFLHMEGPAFKALLLSETGKVHDRFPTRFERYLVAGASHTAILAGFYSLAANGVPLMDWTEELISGSSRWPDVVENGGN